MARRQQRRAFVARIGASTVASIAASVPIPAAAHMSLRRTIARRWASSSITCSSIAVVVLVLSSTTATRIAAQDSTAHAAPAPATFTIPPLEFRAFVQTLYRTGDPLNKDGYRIRKADVKVSGDLSPHVKWRISADLAKTLGLTTTTALIRDTTAINAVSVDQKTRILQEAAVSYTTGRAFTVDIGQQLVPLTQEGWIALANLETIERSNFIAERSRGVGLGYVFDLGATVNGQVEGVEYHAGLFNEMGDDQGATDTNDQKALIGKMSYHLPFAPGLELGGSGGWEPGPLAQRKQRGGTNAQYKDTHWTFRGETMDARDGLLHRFGWYGLGAYRVTRDLQFSARYDAWDRDKSGESSIANAFERQVLGGVLYAVDGTAGKVALNVIRQTFPNISSVRAATIALFAFQAAW